MSSISETIGLQLQLQDTNVSNLWQAFASRGLSAIAELLVYFTVCVMLTVQMEEEEEEEDDEEEEEDEEEDEEGGFTEEEEEEQD